MANSLTITFHNNPNAIFFPNQVVTGSVDVKIFETIKKARGLRLLVAGDASCKWTESSGGNNTRRMLVYQGEENFLESISYLFGSKDGEPVELPTGSYSYSFSCQLPPTLPYSVDGDYGHVRYKVDANLDIPWAFDLHDEKIFTVARHEDLNLFQELRAPCEFEEIKVFCCWFCKSDPLVLKVRLPKIGYGLGEKIPINVEMINRSNNDVSRTTFELRRVERFHAVEPYVKTKEKKETVVESSARGAKAGETVNFVEFLEIPQILSITNSRYCSVYQITYEIKFVAETGGMMSVCPDIHIPITIGSVGLRDDEVFSSAQHSSWT